MKTKLKAALILAVVALAPAMANAALITINLSGGVLYKNDGTTPLTNNSTIVVLADVDGDGFGNLTAATASFKGDADDAIVARFGSNDFGDAGAGTFAQALNSILVPNAATNLAAGNPFLVVWYDKPYNAADTGPGAGVFYGTYRTDSVLNGSSTGFVIPATGTKTINFLTAANSGSLAESAGRANFQTAAVPEPASLALFMLGGCALTLRRRRVQA